MALLTFPISPVNGQLFPTTPAVGENQYQYDAPNQTWRLLGTATGVVPGTYGDSLNVGQFSVDATGRITFADNVAIAVTGGTVTDVTAGIGLLGGTITTSGTIDLDTAYTDGRYLQLAGGTMTGDITFAGTQSFPAQTLDDVTTAGNTTANSIDVGGLTASGLIYPAADGAANEVIATDGAGNLGWLATAEVVPVPGSSAAGGAVNQIAFGTGFFYFFDGTQWLQVAGNTF